MPSDAQKIFISYTQADREWAEWIAWQLDEAGHEPTLQAWHFGPGSDFVHKMHTAIRESDRTIAVLSPAYEGSAFSFAEWAGAFAEDPTGEDRKLVPVRVEPYEPTGLLRTKVYVDLVDLTEDDARQRLLDVLRGPGKPARAPGFPAANRKMTPSFPGGARVPKYGLPHATDAVFLGRDQDIERLHEAMQPTDAVVLTARISAHGGGGIGKTRLAFEYACRYASEYPGGVFWAVVGDREPIAVWTELARRLFLGVRDLETDNEAALAFLDAIERSDKPQLLVLDDLTGDHQRFSQRLEISGVKIAAMPTSVNVRILITTRFQEVAFARPFLVSRLGKVASVNLLLTRARREADESTAAKDLADGDLDGHPLAVSLAGAYLRKVKNLDISVYLERLRKRGLTEELEKAAKHAGHIIADHERSIAATFQMSHDLLDSSDSLDFLAICLLDLSAFLAPGVEIDASLLIRMARVYAQDSETDEAELAATRLEEISLLEPNRRMHTLVADYVRWSQTPARSRSCCARMLETINSFFPPNMEEDAWKILMPGRKDGWEELTVARRQHIDALNRLADKMAERHSKIAKPLLHKLAISHLNIGEVFFKQGAFSKAANEFILAEGVFKRLAKGGSRNSKWLDGLDRSRLCINRALRESGDIDTVHSIKETMNILKGQTKRRKARQRKQAAGRGRKFYEKQGISSMDQQAAQENLAVAKENAREEIRIFDAKNPSLIHQATPEKATELYQIAGLHMQLGQFQEAKRIYKNILAIDPDNARWLQDLATCHRKCGYVLWQRGHRRESSAEYNRARNLLRKLNLISEDTIYVQWQLELVNLCQDFASLNAVDSTLRREAIKYLEEGIQILNELDKKSQLPSSHRNKIRWFEMRLRQLSD